MARGVVAAIGIAVVVASAVVQAQLRALHRPVAIHWGAAGHANGSAGSGAAASLLLLPLIGGVVVVAVALVRGGSPTAASVTAFLATVVSMIFLVAGWSTWWANRHVEDWHAARLPAAFIILVAVLPLAVAALTAGAALRSRPPAELPTPGRALPAGPAPADDAVWTGQCRARWAIPLGIVLALAGLAQLALARVVANPSIVVAGVILLAIAPAILVFSRVEARVDRHGLVVELGPLRRPSVSLPLDRIAGASVTDVEPMKWGGFGYRGSLRLMGRAAVVLRSGPGIKVDLTDGKSFIVTVDDPDAGAALLSAFAATSPRQP